MSHVAKIEVEIHSLADLKDACKRLGLQFMENQKTYKWYGRYVGDAPLPLGMSEKDLGHCDHAIRVPRCSYEIGVLQRGSRYVLYWDSWQRGGLEQKLGTSAGLLKQAYAVERVKREAGLKGYRVKEDRVQDRIRLTLTA